MNHLLGKFTLYDIIATTIPGFITLLGVCSIMPKSIKNFTNSVNNPWFIFVIALCLSYCIGWCVSEISKTIINLKLKMKFDTKSHLIYFILCNILIIYSVIMIYKYSDLQIVAIELIGLFFCNCLFFFNNYSLKKDLKNHNNNQSLNNIKDTEYAILLNKCFVYLKENYPKFEELTLKYQNEIKQVEVMSEVAYFLIQTDNKYHRIHNYSSSMSFSKNLGVVSLLWAFIFAYHLLYNSNEIFFSNIFILGIIFCLFGFIAMKNRYKKFSMQLKILIATYYLDYLENKKEIKQDAKGENKK